jgi:hypothetical protein
MVGLVARVYGGGGDDRHIHVQGLVRKPEGKRPLGRPRLDGNLILR